MNILVPKKNIRREFARTVLDASMQLSGPTAALSRIWGFTHPTDFERQLHDWRAEITERVNGHDERLISLERCIYAEAQISEGAFDLAFYLCCISTKGMNEGWGFASIVAELQPADEKLLEEAAAELEHFGLVKLEHVLGIPIYGICPQDDLFWAFDQIVMGYSTLDDAEKIANFWMANEENCVSKRLQEKLIWNLRRFNPPLAYLCNMLDSRHCSQTIDPDYRFYSVFLGPNDRFLLKRFLGKNIPIPTSNDTN